ncbi:hypothetical protein CEH05_05500 [Halobacillus halophilus]|uniref:Uncharacterized protein n=1 Tax=Halobacillus halophilus (strain ATCC 35676 / DSM 2266 / JCM 20832 / KCTC 3685 / LMG 17431 / NBRC 102448 / NCIMB 2269) TaxID=866895 RepID=I0JJX0_HALH3|nr:hypothetical protein [Halobacillus halophilus]ASF38589.1 hypothetical protein CEH05_05500 [Halobacillus halophilus]CCG44439.1 hypothetical protein HBHAL_2081 [Halobacillus halophilus DSM 2266]
MINLFLGIGMLFLIGVILWSYKFDPNNALVVSASKKQFIMLLTVLSLLTLYLLSTGVYHSFL